MVNPATQTIDVHAHILSERRSACCKRSVKVAPKLSEVDAEFGTLDVAGNVYRSSRAAAGIWSAACGMAASQVDVGCCRSVQTFLYAQPPNLAAAFAPHQNEQPPGWSGPPRPLIAIATLPCGRRSLPRTSCARHAGPRPARHADRLERGRQNYRRPRAEPVRATAAELGAFILLTPSTQRARIGSRPIISAISSAIRSIPPSPPPASCSAACWNHPSLNLPCTAAVSFPAGLGASCTAGASRNRSAICRSRRHELARFYFDTIVLEGVLEFLVGNAGAGRVLLGSDYPSTWACRTAC
jgi:hypothetical protein